MTEQDMQQMLRPVQTAPEKDNPTLGALRGRYMQAVFDLYRVEEYSVSRTRELLQKDIDNILSLIEFAKDRDDI
jgi:hypothetical protein